LDKHRLLGEGEFGEVWLVSANVLKQDKPQKFAMKTQLKVDQNRGIDASDSIFREIDMMKELRHSQIVDLVTTFVEDNNVHMLLRLLPYGELWDRIHVEDEQGNWNSGLPEDHAKFYAMSIADTLDFIHSRKIVYRDLKPENVLIDGDGYPVIVDLGFTKYCPDKTHTFVGTPNYVAPEIITNAGHNRSVDLWALGVTIYEMITGENPFFYDGMDQTTLYHTICCAKYYPLSEDKGEDLKDFMDKILKKDPVKRLGMLAGGMKDIFNHKWFGGMDLKEIQTKKPQAPWLPAEVIEDGFENMKMAKPQPDASDLDSSISMHGRSCISMHERRPISMSSTSLHDRSSVSLHESIDSFGNQTTDDEGPISLKPKRKVAKRKVKKVSRKVTLVTPTSSAKNSNSGSDPNNFHYESLSHYQHVIRNPVLKRTDSQKKESRRRRDLLKDTFSNLGID